MKIIKEAIPVSDAFVPAGDVYLEAGHICIRKNVVEKIFGAESNVLTIYYPDRSTFMAAPAGQDLFRTIHKGTMQMLKIKNAAGDKSISIREIMLDNPIDESGRDLEYSTEDALHILKIKL